MNRSFSVVIPVLNGGLIFRDCIAALLNQSTSPQNILVIDSGSTDGSLEFLRDKNINIHIIDKVDFDHGGTRNLAESLIDKSDYIVYLTQDAVLNTQDSLESIVGFIDENDLAVAYGRQLPHADASYIAKHARSFNYSSQSCINTLQDIPERGIKVAFCSNSFSIYNRAKFNALGRFPESLIFGEDMYFAATAILNGEFSGYCADAEVRHSHNYSHIEEFKRYFDVGVFHSRQKSVLSKFNNSQSEGMKFVVSETRYLIGEKQFFSVLDGWFRTGIKYIGYMLGKKERRVSLKVKAKLSMNKGYWNKLKEEWQ